MIGKGISSTGNSSLGTYKLTNTAGMIIAAAAIPTIMTKFCFPDSSSGSSAGDDQDWNRFLPFLSPLGLSTIFQRTMVVMIGFGSLDPAFFFTSTVLCGSSVCPGSTF